jgi:hypothetical protein
VKLIKTLSDTIVKELQNAGLKAEYLPNPEGLRKDFMPQGLDLPDLDLTSFVLIIACSNPYLIHIQKDITFLS